MKDKITRWQTLWVIVLQKSVERISRHFDHKIKRCLTFFVLHLCTCIRDWILLVCFSKRYEATEGPRVNFVMRGSSVASYLHEKQTSRIQSLYLYFNYFIKIVPFWLRNIRFFNTKHPVIILRASLFAVTPSHVDSSKIECQNFSYVYRSRKHWECKYWSMKSLGWKNWNIVLQESVDMVDGQTDGQSEKYRTPTSLMHGPYNLSTLALTINIQLFMNTYMIMIYVCMYNNASTYNAPQRSN